MDRKKNWFARGLILLLTLFIGIIIAVSFLWGKSRFAVTSQIVSLILLLVVLALAEVFDNFSVGNLITLKKENQRQETELKKAAAENRELRAQLTSIISNSVSNRNMNIFGFSRDELVQMAGAEEAEAAAAEEKQTEEQAAGPRRPESDYVQRRRLASHIEKLALESLCRQKDIQPLSIVREVKFSDRMVGVDPIMERNIIFDGYYKAVQEELFIEVRIEFMVTSGTIYALYYMLSKVYYYRQANHTRAKVVLLLPALPDSYWQGRSGRSDHSRVLSRLREAFAPAIQNDLLEIVPVAVSEEELNAIRKEIESEKAGGA